MNLKKQILERIGEVSHEDLIDDINEDDELLARAVEAEAKLLQSFVSMIRDVKSLKFLLRPGMGVPFGSDDMDSLKDVMKSKVALEATRQKLRKIAQEKMPILHAVINEILGPTEKEQEARDESKPEMHHDHEEHEHEHEDDD